MQTLPSWIRLLRWCNWTSRFYLAQLINTPPATWRQGWKGCSGGVDPHSPPRARAKISAQSFAARISPVYLSFVQLLVFMIPRELRQLFFTSRCLHCRSSA